MAEEKYVLAPSPTTGADFKVLREQLGLPSAWIAQTLRVDQKTVSRWETGNFIAAEAIELLTDMQEEADLALSEMMKTPVHNGSVELKTYRRDEDFTNVGRHGRYPAAWHRALTGRAQAAFIGRGISAIITYHEKKGA